MSKLDVKVFPIDEPKGSTMAFASVGVDDLAAIRGIRVVDGEKGLFVSMPQSQDKTGIYHDVAFPIDGDLRKEINAAVLDEYEVQSNLAHEQRGYAKPETAVETNSRDVSEIKLDVKVFPISEPKGDTVAFASIGLDEAVAIRGIRVVSSNKGNFVSMPQSQDKNGEFHDIAFPLSGDLRKEISKEVLRKYTAERGDRKKTIDDRLQEGKERAAQHVAPAKEFAAKSHGSTLE